MNDQTILEEGHEVGTGNDPLYRNSFVMSYNGSLYPFCNGAMLNPLDPVVLLSCIGSGHDDRAIETAMKICRTVDRAFELRKDGYSIITRYKSGAPKAILENKTNNVLILGDLAKKENILLPILSTQLADEQYDQSGVDAWKERGFKTPRKYDIVEKTSDVKSGVSEDFDEIETQVLNYKFGGICVSFVHTEGERRVVSDDKDRDWDYEYVEDDYMEISREASDQIPNKTECPKFVWQDKGVESED